MQSSLIVDSPPQSPLVYSGGQQGVVVQDNPTQVYVQGAKPSQPVIADQGIVHVAGGDLGPQGEIGPVGEAGVTANLYLAYAEDSSGTGFSLSPSSERKYLGLLSSTAAVPSGNWQDYTWLKVVGEDGQHGQYYAPSGNYLWMKYAPNNTPTPEQMQDLPDGMDYLGVAYNKPTVEESTDYRDYLWARITGETGAPGLPGLHGNDGKDGNDGTTLDWRGTYLNHPSDPEDGWAYFNSSNGNAYVYQNGVWFLLSETGPMGPGGARGSQTVQVETATGTWDATVAENAFPGGPVDWDIVQILKADDHNVQVTRRYDSSRDAGDRWVSYSHAFLGNVLVDGTLDGRAMNAESRLTVGSNDQVAVLSGNTGEPRIWAGKADHGVAPFRVDQAGQLYAEGANLKSLSVLTPDGDTLLVSDGNTTTMQSGSNYLPGVSGWMLDSDGNIEVNNGTFRGHIEAVTGEFKGAVYAEQLIGSTDQVWSHSTGFSSTKTYTSWSNSAYYFLMSTLQFAQAKYDREFVFTNLTVRGNAHDASAGTKTYRTGIWIDAYEVDDYGQIVAGSRQRLHTMEIDTLLDRKNTYTGTFHPYIPDPLLVPANHILVVSYFSRANDVSGNWVGRISHTAGSWTKVPNQFTPDHYQFPADTYLNGTPEEARVMGYADSYPYTTKSPADGEVV